MQILFVHDHIFHKVGDSIYSTGGLNNEALSRYAEYCDNLIVFARIRDEEKVNGKWSEISNPKITVMGNSGFSSVGLKEEVKHADKIFIRLPSVLGLKAILYAKRLHKPYLTEVVGCAWDALWNHSLKGKIIAPFMFIMTKLAIKSSPYVLYVTREFLQKRYPTTHKTIACSDVEILKDNSILKKRIDMIESGEKRLFILGTIGAVDVKYKGQEYVIRALGELKKRGIKQYVYQLVGNGDQKYLKDIAKKYDVPDNVIFLGGLPHEKINSWLDTIDIYIQPSMTEGLPRTLIEAMSRGLPSLASNVGGIPELLDEKDMFHAYSINEIVFKLQEMEKNRMLAMAYRSIDVAKKYEKTVLDDKRQRFYSEFING